TIVDLGTGTGALAAKCVERAPDARIVGIDADSEILLAARERLGERATFVNESFLRASIPTCDAVVASFALHHVRTRPAKSALYRRGRQARRAGGGGVDGGCPPAGARPPARRHRGAGGAARRAAHAPPRAGARGASRRAPGEG